MNEKITSRKILQEIEKSKGSIRALGVKKIGVFGSFVKKKQHKKSDIDILVSFNKPSFDSFMNLKFMLEKMFGRKIDLVMEKNLKQGLGFVKKEAEYARL